MRGVDPSTVLMPPPSIERVPVVDGQPLGGKRLADGFNLSLSVNELLGCRAEVQLISPSWKAA